MAYCAICDELVAEDEAWLSPKILSDAVAKGLRPPPGKLKRTAAMMVCGARAIDEKAAELEREWVERFIGASSDPEPACLCKGCKADAARRLNVVL